MTEMEIGQDKKNLLRVSRCAVRWRIKHQWCPRVPAPFLLSHIRHLSIYDNIRVPLLPDPPRLEQESVISRPRRLHSRLFSTLVQECSSAISSSYGTTRSTRVEEDSFFFSIIFILTSDFQYAFKEGRPCCGMEQSSGGNGETDCR